MNIAELARQVRIPLSKLREILPALGFDIGLKAIKVDDKIARDIIARLSSQGVREGHLASDKRQGTRDKGQMTNDRLAGVVTENVFQAFRPESVTPTFRSEDKKLQIGETVVVKDLARQMNLPVTKLILELMKNGVMAALNQSIDFETAAIISEDLGFQVEKADSMAAGEKNDWENEAKKRAKYFEDDPKNLVPRPPVIVVMGHVDHGKTKLLDAIRQTNVMEGEAGGITQHIGAYRVEKNGHSLTFIDTPGHEAFSAMRSRGARVADIAILVVAADDGVQPQTIEALSHIRAANLPFIVAINKIDKAEANLDKTKTALAKIGLTPEGWGGKTICVEISAKQKINIDGLLETLLLVYEMEKEHIMANPNREAIGTIIESRLDKGEGPVATVLVQTGTLKKGEVVKIGPVIGKIRLMKNWQGHQVDKVLPGTPAKIIGLRAVPEVGEILQVITDIKSIKKEMREKKKNKGISISQPSFVARSRVNAKPVSKQGAVSGGETGHQTLGEEETNIKKINIILKCDVLGSEEAILEAINNLEQPDLIINTVRVGLGNITEVDVERAENQKALLIGFNVRPTLIAENMASEKNTIIKTFKIIYELLDYLKGEMNKMLESTLKTTVIGKIKVLKIFRTEKKFQIVGGKVVLGKVTNNVKLNIIRQDELIGRANLVELQSGKQTLSEVLTEEEAGLKIEGFNQVKEGDIIEVVKEEKISRQI